METKIKSDFEKIFKDSLSKNELVIKEKNLIVIMKCIYNFIRCPGKTIDGRNRKSQRLIQHPYTQTK